MAAWSTWVAKIGMDDPGVGVEPQSEAIVKVAPCMAKVMERFCVWIDCDDTSHGSKNTLSKMTTTIRIIGREGLPDFRDFAIFREVLLKRLKTQEVRTTQESRPAAADLR